MSEITDTITRDMVERMQEAMSGADVTGIADNMQDRWRSFEELPAPQWDKMPLLLAPLGVATVAFVGFVASRFGLRVAGCSLLLLVCIVVVHAVLPRRPLTKSLPYAEQFQLLGILGSSAAGTTLALVAVSSGRLTARQVVGSAFLGGFTGGAVVGFVEALPKFEWGYLLGATLVTGLFGATLPGVLFGSIAGYLYGLHEKTHAARPDVA